MRPNKDLAESGSPVSASRAARSGLNGRLRNGAINAATVVLILGVSIVLTLAHRALITQLWDLQLSSLTFGSLFAFGIVCLGYGVVRSSTLPRRQIRDLVAQMNNQSKLDPVILGENTDIAKLANAINDLLQESKNQNQRLLNEIAERKNAEAALRENDKTFRQIADQIGQLLWMCSADGEQVIYVSRAYQKIWGRQSQELYDNPRLWLQDIHPDDRDTIVKAFAEKAIQGIEYRAQYRILRADGSVRWIQDHAFPIHDTRGQIKNIAGFAQDITQLKKTEAERLQAQKLEAVGQLAAGIAHEINTPAQYVADNTQFIQESLGEILRMNQGFRSLLNAARENSMTPEVIAATESLVAETDLEYLMLEMPQAINEASDGIRQISRIVKAMKEFSHPGGEEQEFSDINRIIENSITVTRNEWKYVAQLETDLEDALPQVPCFPQLIGQVILNLIVNAAHAIKDQPNSGDHRLGRIKISTRSIDDRIEILISDTGTGIEEAVREKIFDPFFTTKEVGKGTGQGLAFVRSAIIDRHAGTIRFDTEPGVGTTFVIGLGVNAPSMPLNEEVA